MAASLMLTGVAYLVQINQSKIYFTNANLDGLFMQLLAAAVNALDLLLVKT